MIGQNIFSDIMSALLLPCFVIGCLAYICGSKVDAFSVLGSVIEGIITFVFDVALQLLEMFLEALPTICNFLLRLLSMLGTAIARGVVLLIAVLHK